MSNWSKLSPAESRVIRLLARGYEDISAAAVLKVSPNTVRSHRKNVARKLGGGNIVTVLRQLYEFRPN